MLARDRKFTLFVEMLYLYLTFNLASGILSDNIAMDCAQPIIKMEFGYYYMNHFSHQIVRKKIGYLLKY